MRYNGPATPSDQIRDLFTRGGIPVTLTLLGMNVLTFLACFFARDTALPFVMSYLTFDPAVALHEPWTFVTYPLVSIGFSLLWVVMLVLLWLAGGSLERSWGSRRFGIFFFAISAVSAASLLLGCLLLHQTLLLPIYDVFLPLSALGVAFCMINPNETLQFYWVPMQGRWVALIITAWVFFDYGQMLGWELGLFALGGIVVASLYVRFGRSWADIGYYTAPRRGPDLRVFPAAKSTPARRKMTLDGSRRRSPLDLAGRWRDWQERRRLERLLRNSGFSDKDSAWNDEDEHRPRGA